MLIDLAIGTCTCAERSASFGECLPVFIPLDLRRRTAYRQSSGVSFLPKHRFPVANRPRWVEAVMRGNCGREPGSSCPSRKLYALWV